MAPEAVLNGLRPIGMACEGDMFRATAGVNTHEVHFFFLGLCVIFIGLLQLNQPVTPTTVCSVNGGKFLPWPDRSRNCVPIIHD